MHNFLVGLALGAYYTFCGLILYGWFLLPLTHTPISYWQLYGIGLFIDTFSISWIVFPKDREDTLFVYIAKFLFASIVLLIGFIIHSLRLTP